MKNFLFSAILKYAIIILAIFGLITCALWYPLSISLTTVGLSVDPAPITQAENIEFWSQLIFYWLTSVPCFFILALWWIIAGKVKRGSIFTPGTAKTFKLCSVILSIDLSVFLIGNQIFAMLGWNEFLVIYLIIFAVGTAVASLLAVTAHYTRLAATLQEEMEYTV